MNCADAEKLIALDVEGDLAETQAAALRNHLAACAPCEQFAQEMRESQQLLKSLRHELPPESLLSGARQAALQQLCRRPRDGGWGRAAHPRLRWVYAAGGLALVAWATMGWLALHTSETPRSAAGAAAGARNQETVAASAGSGAPQLSAESSQDSRFLGNSARSEERIVARQSPGNEGRNPRAPGGSSSGVNAAPIETSGAAILGTRIAPRVEIVSTSFSKNSPDLDSGTTVLKIASSDPNVLLYWVMDGQGGS